MREQVKAAIVECLNAHAQEENIDDLLTEAVLAVFEMFKKPRIAVRYIGRRETYTDALYGTGLWSRGQVKLVEEDVAMNNMLAHPDVYVRGDEAEATEAVDSPKAIDDTADHLEQARDAVLAMRSVKAVKEFVANNFSGATLELPAGARLDEYRVEAIRMIDKYHVGE